MSTTSKTQALPTDAAERKAAPVFSGVLRYFPLALAEVARVSKAGNDQHNPRQPLHWARGKSTDHADCLVRHQIDAGTIDSDGQRHSAKVAWRALAQLQQELELEAGIDLDGVMPSKPKEVDEVVDPDWLPWRGGTRPVDRSVVVSIRLRDGWINTGIIASSCRWEHTGRLDDIVAYKVIRP